MTKIEKEIIRSEKICVNSWEELVDLMDEDALRATYEDTTWEDGDISGFLNVYSLYHIKFTGSCWDVILMQEMN